MRDKRPVDELSIEELERILAIRRREARVARARRYADRQVGVPDSPPPTLPDVAYVTPLAIDPGVASPAIALPPADSSPAEAVAQPPSATELPTIEPRFEDDFFDPPRPPDPRPRRVLWWNRLLVLVEVAAVIGLVVLLGSLVVSLQAVTQTTDSIQAAYQATNAAAFVPPTATPVIDVVALVLPGGHTYDASTGSGQFNLNEVPVQYRTAYQQQVLSIAPAALPTPSPQAALTIQIPALNVDAPVVEGDSWDDLQRGVGHHVGSANPGEPGNLVLAGHDDIYGSVFKDLPKLKPGDQITVTTQTNRFVYTVQNHDIVSPTDTSVMDNSRRDIQQMTLITCYPYQVDSQRYIVYATLNQS